MVDIIIFVKAQERGTGHFTLFVFVSDGKITELPNDLLGQTLDQNMFHVLLRKRKVVVTHPSI